MPGACGIDDRGRDARAPGKPQVALSYYHQSPKGLYNGVPGLALAHLPADGLGMVL